jgi:hypothetical protein
MSNFCTIDREIEAKLKAEVADLMAKAEAADAADPRKSAAALESLAASLEDDGSGR